MTPEEKIAKVKAAAETVRHVESIQRDIRLLSNSRISKLIIDDHSNEGIPVYFTKEMSEAVGTYVCKLLNEKRDQLINTL